MTSVRNLFCAAAVAVMTAPVAAGAGAIELPFSFDRFAPEGKTVRPYSENGVRGLQISPDRTHRPVKRSVIIGEWDDKPFLGLRWEW